MIECEHVGEKDGGVAYAEVEIDAPSSGELALRYNVSSIPTLLAFSRQEAQMETRVTSVADMKDRRFLQQWVEEEARRAGTGGAGGRGFIGLFGDIFGR
ncbi:MAG: hypothetical protein M1838_004351 [Thelocarpon superellum]|nr:MAG: hypothetical protein M1838_004351 [Thelocarpon superellum]